MAPKRERKANKTQAQKERKIVLGAPAPLQQKTVLEAPTPLQQNTVLEAPTPLQQKTVLEAPAPLEQKTVLEAPAPLEQKTALEAPAPLEQKIVLETPAPLEQKTFLEAPAPLEQKIVLETPAPLEQKTVLEAPAPLEQKIVLEAPAPPEQKTVLEAPAPPEQKIVLEAPAPLVQKIVQPAPPELTTLPIEGEKHPLENTWSFWMFTNDKKKWEDNLIELTTFDTVEDYWCLYHYMKTPSELSLGQDYSVFKKGVRPMWEDAANKKGGRWLISLEKRRGDLDWMWLDVVLLLIGENFENNEEICGVTVNVRAKCKIGIWTSDATNQRANMGIGKKLKEILGNHVKIVYQVHDSNKSIHTI